MHAPTTRSLAFASIMLVLLTVAFETVLGIVDHKAISQIIDHYAIWLERIEHRLRSLSRGEMGSSGRLCWRSWHIRRFCGRG